MVSSMVAFVSLGWPIMKKAFVWIPTLSHRRTARSTCSLVIPFLMKFRIS